jgi:oligoendopeptidase F
MNAPIPQDQLPSWDLSDLYPGLDSPELKRDLERAAIEAKAFAARYETRMASLSGAEMAESLKRFEVLQELLGRITSYASLVYSGDQSDSKIGQFFQNVQEKVTDITSALLFFSLEINRIEDAEMEQRLQDPALAHYQPWVRDCRAWRPHQLSDDLEKILHEKYVAGRAAWTRLFDETMARLRFPMDGKDMTSAEILHLLSEKDGEQRKRAAQNFGKVMGDNIGVFALITNTLAKDKEIEDRWRKYQTPPSSRNLANQVEDEVVEALVSAVKASYPKLAHRYYKLKAKWFGEEQLDYWDRNAPLPESDDRVIPWPEATRTVLDAYGAFSPDLASVGKRFFDNAWIDAPVRPGKSPGAFAHPTVPSAHPYLLLNYQGKVRDVMTLAHELGHGVHQVLSAGQGYLMADTPLTLAETASVFGEMLTFQALLKAQTDPAKRKVMLASKVEDMINTVVRQIAFYDFELRVHTERRQGELTAERVGEIWMDVQKESLGPVFRFHPEYANFWAYIPHFVHTPFYVYAYAFGDCLVNSLYAVYQDGAPGFQQRYLDMLKAGGTKRHKELLAPFGLDASDPAFWQKGIGVIAGFIDELEKM